MKKEEHKKLCIFIENMDFGTFEQLFDPLFDLIIKSFPTSDTKKNVVVVETR